jgi:hypothetical protein
MAQLTGPNRREPPKGFRRARVEDNDRPTQSHTLAPPDALKEELPMAEALPLAVDRMKGESVEQFADRVLNQPSPDQDSTNETQSQNGASGGEINEELNRLYDRLVSQETELETLRSAVITTRSLVDQQGIAGQSRFNWILELQGDIRSIQEKEEDNQSHPDDIGVEETEGGSGGVAFKTIDPTEADGDPAGSGHADVVADSSTDTLTVKQGNGINLITDATADSIQIFNTGAAPVDSVYSTVFASPTYTTDLVRANTTGVTDTTHTFVLGVGDDVGDGVKFDVITRINWDPASASNKLVCYFRQLTFDAGGRLTEVSAETQYEIADTSEC